MRSGISLISLFLILLYRSENIPQELMFFKHSIILWDIFVY